jgi:hypothetical protein
MRRDCSFWAEICLGRLSSLAGQPDNSIKGALAHCGARTSPRSTCFDTSSSPRMLARLPSARTRPRRARGSSSKVPALLLPYLDEYLRLVQPRLNSDPRRTGYGSGRRVEHCRMPRSKEYLDANPRSGSGFGFVRTTVEKSNHRHRRLLRMRVGSPCGGRAADKRDELATLHFAFTRSPHRRARAALRECRGDYST